MVDAGRADDRRKRVRRPQHIAGGASDGGAYLTVADTESTLTSILRRYDRQTEHSRDTFLSPHASINERVDYGYGIYIRRGPGAAAYFITGSDAGVGFDSRHFTDRDLTVTIMSNRTDGEAQMRNALLFGERPVLAR